MEVRPSGGLKAWTDTQHTNQFTFTSWKVIFYPPEMVLWLGAQAGQPPAHE